MFCPKCGTENNDSAAFCASCGYALQNAALAGAGNQNPYEKQDVQNNYQQSYNADPPMKWWKFLVYFAIVAIALIDLLLGVITMTGSHYGEYAPVVYAQYRGLKALDITFGISQCGIAAWGILTRQSLYNFKKNGPRMLLMTYAMHVADTILYAIFSAAILGVSVGAIMSVSGIVGIIRQIVMIVLNKIYFDKRAFLFVN